MAFSLIELLVVLAFIGVLVALLLTTVSRAKAKAHQIQCVGNLNQLGVSLTVFVTENHIYPIWVAPTNFDPSGRWWGELLERGGFGNSNPGSHFYQEGIWRCPSAVPRDGSGEPYYGYNAFGMLAVGNRTNNFGLQGHQAQNPGILIPINDAEVVAPAEMMAIGESDAFAFMRAQSYDFHGGVLRHGDLANLVFCDGHVDSPTANFLFDDTGDEALSLWNRDHQPHRDRLKP